jgi:Peptidase C13 family
MFASLRGLLANLRAGARLAFFARVQRQDFHVDAAQLLFAVIVSALVDNAADWVRQPPDAVFDWAALGAELASFAVLVAIAALLAWVFGDVSLVVALPILVLVSLPVVQIVNLAPHLAGSRENLPAWLPDTLYYLVLLWFLAVLWRSAFVAMQPGPRRFARSIAGGLLLAIPLFVPAGVLPDASWWREAAAPAALDASNPASEPVLALQRELQDEALGALEDHKQGETDLYFVAFAPDGAGAKWRPHVARAKKIMDLHWGTQGRSLAYVNDVTMLTEAPMATVTHLREALEEIASASNPDEDIVMLYLAGRNNPDGSLLVALPPLGLVQLTGAGLAHLFRQAGIRWRVVVLATCVAEPFVEALADDHTLVIAAAGRAERAAGCGSGEEPTAFGDALFGETLSGAKSLPAAFESVRQTLSRRGPAPSLHVGTAIGAQLGRLRGAGGGRANARAATING